MSPSFSGISRAEARWLCSGDGSLPLLLSCLCLLQAPSSQCTLCLTTCVTVTLDLSQA